MDERKCSNCDIFKYYNEFYDKDSKCMNCRSIINKQKRLNNRKTLINFQDKIITTLYEEIKELKNKYKRNGMIY